MARMKLFLIGTPQVTIDNRPVAIKRRKEQALLFYLAAQGDMEKATLYLALAFRYPQVAQSWVGQLPDIVDLRHKLRESLSPALFSGLWEQGQSLDISATAAELAEWLNAQA